MPIKEENLFLFVDAQKAVQATLAKDIDYLVDKISENLILKAKQKQKRRICRTSPYSIPVSKCQRDQGTCTCSLQHCQKKHNAFPDDPHQLLQELLAAGTLVTEAVNRLHTRKRKKSFHYESDDDLDL